MAESKTSNVTSRGSPTSTTGTANPGFNLIGVINELPAAEFFWYNSVPPEKRPEYCRLLGQLLQLFITPHVYSFYPYKEGSYLKKYEYVFQTYNQKELSHMLTFLFYLETSRTNYETHKITLDAFTGAEILHLSTNTFENSVQEWYFNDASKPLYFVNFDIKYDFLGSTHAVFLGIKKYPRTHPAFKPIVKFMYFDPHGYLEEDDNFARVLKQKLVAALQPGGVEVVQFLLQCPNLQKESHGGNCVQHTAMVFTMLMKNPDLFDDVEALMFNVGRHTTLNVLLFSLSIFLRTMPKVHLVRYYYAMLVKDVFASNPVPLSEETRFEGMTESNVFSKEVSTIFHMPNCPNLFGNIRDCDTTLCVKCGGRCQYRALVQLSKAGCHVLTPIEIAKTMFQLYFQIKDMAVGIDPEQRSFLLKDMEDELDFVRAEANEDYARLGLPVYPE